MSVAESFASSAAARLVILAASACLAGCAGPVIRPSLSPSKPKGDALLVLPGFGYSRDGEKALRSLAAAMAGEGVDLYVPTYVTRAGLAPSRAKLERFIRENRLDRYERLHVFAFIAGAWTLNPLVERHELPNLATVIYDRSPFQERAPRIAAAKLHFLRVGAVRLAGIRRRQDALRAAHGPERQGGAPGGDDAHVVHQAP